MNFLVGWNFIRNALNCWPMVTKGKHLYSTLQPYFYSTKALSTVVIYLHQLSVELPYNWGFSILPKDTLVATGGTRAWTTNLQVHRQTLPTEPSSTQWVGTRSMYVSQSSLVTFLFCKWPHSKSCSCVWLPDSSFNLVYGSVAAECQSWLIHISSTAKCLVISRTSAALLLS